MAKTKVKTFGKMDTAEVKRFIKTWNTSSTRGEVMEKTGLDTSNMNYARVSLKKYNIQLKSFRTHGNKDWDSIAKFAAKSYSN